MASIKQQSKKATIEKNDTIKHSPVMAAPPPASSIKDGREMNLNSTNENLSQQQSIMEQQDVSEEVFYMKERSVRPIY